MSVTLVVANKSVNEYTLGVTIWQPTIPRGQGPVYRALADALERAVETGVLTAGSRLPPHRALARALGVTVMTVTRAYRDAARRGLVEATVGRGSFVRRPGTEPARRETAVADLAANVIQGPAAADPGPALTAAIAAGLAEVAYRAPAGNERHRAAGAAWLARSGLRVRPEQVLVTVGAQHGLFVALASRTKPGDVVLAEHLTYHGLRAIARLLHLELRGVRLDRGGLDPDDLDRQARRTRARVLVCVPTFQNPTGTVMSVGRRREVVEVARRRDLTLVEDDVYGFLLPAPPPPLAVLAPERTLHLTGTSKSLSPALRVGYLVAPEERREPLATLIGASVWGVSAPAAEIAASWIERGVAARVVAHKRALIAVRQRAARRALQGLRSASHPASPHLWVELPARWPAEALVAAAAARGVRLLGPAAFWLGRERPPGAVRVCLGAVSDAATLESALARVHALASRAPTDPAPIV